MGAMMGLRPILRPPAGWCPNRAEGTTRFAHRRVVCLRAARQCRLRSGPDAGSEPPASGSVFRIGHKALHPLCKLTMLSRCVAFLVPHYIDRLIGFKERRDRIQSCTSFR